MAAILAFILAFTLALFHLSTSFLTVFTRFVAKILLPLF
jgi:hypothetical protein